MQTLDDKSMKKLVKYVEENNIPVSIMRSIGTVSYTHLTLPTIA